MMKMTLDKSGLEVWCTLVDESLGALMQSTMAMTMRVMKLEYQPPPPPLHALY